LLNGGHSAAISPTHRDWLVKDLASIPKNQTVISFVHQPALGALVRERGIPAAVRRAYAPLEGEVWLIAGHDHVNRDRVFDLPKTKIIEATIARATPHPRIRQRPGYWVYCIKNGKVFARIFHMLDKGYRIGPAVNLSKSKPIRLPFESRRDILRKYMVGDKDERSCRVKLIGGDCEQWLYYIRELTYRALLNDLPAQPDRIGLLASGPFDGFSSHDNASWQPLERIEEKDSVHVYPIPANCLASGQMFIKITRIGKADVGVAGFAILGKPDEPATTAK
jgi:hypothetical protein